MEMRVAMSSTEVKLQGASTEVKLEGVMANKEMKLEEVTSSTRAATESSTGEKWKSDLHSIRNVPERK